MNGEEKKLAVSYWEIWREEHDKNAKEHREDIKDIKDALANLPCATHIERMTWMIWAIRGAYIFTATAVGWLSWMILEHISRSG